MNYFSTFEYTLWEFMLPKSIRSHVHTFLRQNEVDIDLCRMLQFMHAFDVR